MKALCLSCHVIIGNRLATSKSAHAKLVCTACHTPHASDYRPHLKMPRDALCRSCHSGCGSWAPPFRIDQALRKLHLLKWCGIKSHRCNPCEDVPPPQGRVRVSDCEGAPAERTLCYWQALASFGVVTDVHALHQEEHIFRDVGGMVGDALQIPRHEDQIQRAEIVDGSLCMKLISSW